MLTVPQYLYGKWRGLWIIVALAILAGCRSSAPVAAPALAAPTARQVRMHHDVRLTKGYWIDKYPVTNEASGVSSLLGSVGIR